MSDPRYWLWWQHKLEGKDPPASEGTPYAGFYRAVRKASYGGTKYAIPVAYWPGENGEMHCREGFQDVSDERGQDIWVNVCNNPVPEDWYREVAENEAPEWRDGMATTAPRGDNRPPEDTDFEFLKGVIEELAGSAKIYLERGPITEQTDADRISNHADKLSEYWKKAEEARKKERQPHDEALKEIQLKWTPLLLMAEAYKNLKFKLLTPWQLGQKKALEEEARAAVAAGETMPETTRRPRAGTRGRAMTLKSFKSAEITDYEACLAFFKDSQDVRGTVQDLANKAVRAGIEVPGVKMTEEMRTV
jgi:hypothetical protein